MKNKRETNKEVFKKFFLNKNTILFDLDDTIYDEKEAHNFALKKTYYYLNKKINISFKKFNELYELSKKEIHIFYAKTIIRHQKELYFQKLLNHLGLSNDYDLILKLRTIYWDSFLKKIRPKKNLIKLLSLLKKNNFKIGIVSNGVLSIQLKKLVFLGLSKYVDDLTVSEETYFEKPNELIFILALNKLNSIPEKSILIGDNLYKDIQGAKNLGIKTILLLEEESDLKNIDINQKPDLIIKEFSELIKSLFF